MGTDLETRIRHVTAVLGPTNTGKTHLAIERMVGHESGMIGLPLRLLAREVYDKVAAKVGADQVALITGEEKIKPERARFWVCTVEAMPRDVSVDFLAIDEVQLAADPERGHVFTDRLLHARGRSETLLLGAQTMREAIADLIPGANFISRPRLSKLSYSGEKKITRLPQRTAIVAFSASEVYTIAELIRRQRGGAAVVMGALSPRTRNAQVALYQSGDVDFLVATDAIGMGLNLDVDHVAFSAVRKFDGQNHRNLTPGELGQIAGRAGRHMNDGSFGVTGGAEPFEPDMVERLETHTFDSIRVLQWRSRQLNFASIDALRDSLREMPREARLTRARMADDVVALDTVTVDREITDSVTTPAAVTRLWDICQVPDYRKISSQNHAELIGALAKHILCGEGHIPEDWFAKQVAFSDRVDGDIDTLSNRLAHIRTWTFVSNRPDWLKDPGHWQGRTRAIEDSLSDALHELLTQRFVDRRTSALMRGMRDKTELNAEIADDGAIHVEKHFVGRLKGFRFQPDAQAEGIHGKATRHAAAQVLSRELSMRARRVAPAKADAFRLTRQARILWRDEEIARLEASDDHLKPSVTVFVDEHLSGPDKEKVQARLDAWIVEIVSDKLKPLAEIAKAEDISGLARGIAFRLTENFGVLKREAIGEEIKSLDQDARAQLRKYGVRFGAFNIFIPLLLKPAAADLCLTLWSLKQAAQAPGSTESFPEPPRAGLTSVVVDATAPEAFFRAAGYHVCGPRAVRIDILERLADLIRPLLAWRPNATNPQPAPNGSTGDGGFVTTPEMMSILGCSPNELGNVFQALGFRLDRRPMAAKPAEPAVAVVPSLAENQNLPADVSAAPGEPVPSVAEMGQPEPMADGVGVESGIALPPADAVPVACALSPVAEATATATDDGVFVPAESAAEPVVILYEDVWRPRRHHAERRNPRHRRPPATERVPRATAAPTSDVAVPAVPEPTAVADSAEPVRSRQEDGPRRDRERDRDRDRNREPRDGRKGGPRDRDHRSQGSGPANGGDRRRPAPEPRGPRVHTAAPPSKTSVDPDSPFAALSALREAMEQRAKGQGTQ